MRTSTLTPKERIRMSLSHQAPPDRVPFSWGFCATAEMNQILTQYFAEQGVDWSKLRELASDIVMVSPEYTGPPLSSTDLRTARWGIKRKNISYGTGDYQEFTDFPLAGIEDPDQLQSYPWPSPDDYDYVNLRRNFLNAYPEQLKAVQYPGGNPFEIYCWMTGLEEALMNVLINPELVMTALTYIVDFMDTQNRRVLNEIGDLIELVFFADDLGSQTGLLMSRECYRSILQPFHRRLTSSVKELAPHAKSMFHSDGAVFDVLPDLIDAGIDVHEAVQTDAEGMDPERLKAAYGDKLSFHGGISVQQLLPNSDVETVKQECQHLVQVLGKNGGYIAAPTHAIQVGTPPENIPAMLEGVLGKELTPKYMEQARM